MRRGRRQGRLLTAGALALLAAWLGYKAWQAGELQALSPRRLACRRVTGVVGPEDITVDAARGVAYVSSNDWRALQTGRPKPGAIYRYTPGEASAPRQLPHELGEPFHPHGISLWKNPSGADLLYVVNHPVRGRHTIEVFEVRVDRLVHRRTLRDPALVSPNDLSVVDGERFYVTNDHGVVDKFAQLIHDVLGLARAHVLYYDGERFRVVARDLAYANGIQVSQDGKRVHVAESTGKRLRTYARSPRDGSLRLLRNVELHTGADNLELGADGSLYVAGHPKLLSFLIHVQSRHRPSPSQVLRVEGNEAATVYLDLGEELSASTVAAPWRDRLLIGSVLDDHFLDCAR